MFSTDDLWWHKKIEPVTSLIKMILEKRDTFTNDLIFIDGLWGTGKSLLGPIVSSMDRVERYKIEGIYEYISSLYYIDKITQDAALWMLGTYVDSSQYHNTIGREVNLRWDDESGLKNAQDKLIIIRRLFGPEGDSKVEEINSKNLAFFVMSHLLMLTPTLLSLAYGDRVKVLEMVRHPLYLVRYFAAHLARFESSREFTMSFYHEDTKVPWFAQHWKAEFVRSNPFERAVLCITRLYPWLDTKIVSARASGLPVLDLSFEEAVFETDSTLEKLELFTGRKHNPRIATILKRQMLPRETISKGKGKGDSSYGWRKSDQTERETYTELLEEVRANCSLELQSEMMKVIAWYNGKYPSLLSHYQ